MIASLFRLFARAVPAGTVLVTMIFAPSQLPAASPTPWTLTYGRYGAAVVADQDALYVIGGANGIEGSLSSIERIDLKTGLSQSMPWRVLPRRFLAAVLADHRIYLLGGEGRNGPVATFETIDLSNGKVKDLGSMPTPRRALSAVEIDGLIFTFGGSAIDDREHLSRQAMVEVFDRVANKWMLAPSMPFPKEVPAVRDGRFIYALGGYNGTREPEKSCARFDLTTAQWEKLDDTPMPSSGYAAAAIDGAIVCFGDYTELDRVTAYVPDQKRWVRLSLAYHPRRHAGACVVGNTVYVIGGNSHVDGSGEALRLIERFPVAELRAAIARASP